MRGGSRVDDVYGDGRQVSEALIVHAGDGVNDTEPVAKLAGVSENGASHISSKLCSDPSSSPIQSTKRFDGGNAVRARMEPTDSPQEGVNVSVGHDVSPPTLGSVRSSN